MTFEKKFPIKDESTDLILRMGQSQSIHFNSGELSVSDKHSLFFTCEDKKYYRYKGEGGNDILYQMIDDSLDMTHAERNIYCLDMTCDEPKSYAKRAAYKIYWKPNGVVYEGNGYWSVGISAKADHLHVKPEGYLRLRMEKWLLKENVEPGLTADAPDETVIIDIESGTYDYRVFEKTVRVEDETTACVLFTLEGLYYEGNVYFECPFFTSSSGENLLPDFDVNVLGSEAFAWCGQNLSKREWPHFGISLNGTPFFDDETFLRMHRYSPVQIDIPGGLIVEGDNTICITYKSCYHETLPVAIREMAIIERPLESFTVLHCPEFAVAGKLMHVLIETEEKDVTLRFESDDFDCMSPLVFGEKGIHVISLKPVKEKVKLWRGR